MAKETKIITFENNEYKIPVWTKFVARDLDGDVFAYELEPWSNLDCCSWETTGRFQELFIITDPETWSSSIIKLA